MFDKHTLIPILVVLFQRKMSFCQIKPKKLRYKKINNICFLVYGQKS
jgi:hypothetical protein